MVSDNGQREDHEELALLLTGHFLAGEVVLYPGTGLSDKKGQRC